MCMKREITEGTICGNERGYAFFIVKETDKKDYFVSHGDLRGAMHGDTVIAEICENGERTTARVLKIVKRGVEKLVGTYFSGSRGGFVVPDDRRFFNDVFVPFGKGLYTRSGDKVICKIVSYPKRKNPEGIVVKILGRQFDKEAELKSIYFNFNLPDSFSEKVLKEAETLKREKLSFEGRRDFTKDLIMTIDGEDARDFDDAISVSKTAEGYVLGVHIADVSHYVTFGSEIDKEAYERGTSVYFPENVIPMLPEVLCNDLCSLRQGVERYALSCVMVIDNNGKVRSYEIVPSVIKSRARMTYTDVQRILNGESEAINKYSPLVATIKTFDELSDILIKKREFNGNIDLDSAESLITVDKNGNINVEKAKSDKAHRIIEEFMILANCTIAQHMFYLEAPFVYRIHEKPADDKLETLFDFLSSLGLNIKRRKGEIFSKDFQKILISAKDKSYYSIVNRVVLRSMQKARYSTQPIGHFGLCEQHYCHFTSPIRRYPDLVVHRLLKETLIRGTEDLEKKYSEYLPKVAQKSSETERNAEEAERAVDEYYKMLYISNFVGEEFEGVISGVKEFGIFVELSNGIEGKVNPETIKGKKLIIDEKKFTVTNGKTVLKLGQTVKIKVAGVNIMTRKAEFVLVQ